MIITDVLISFRDTQDITCLQGVDTSVNMEDLNVIVIEILSWLKLEHKRMVWQEEGRKIKLKPMPLNPQYSWCNLLKELLGSKNVFSDVFVNDSNTLKFRCDIAEEYRTEARKIAFEKYNHEKII